MANASLDRRKLPAQHGKKNNPKKHEQICLEQFIHCSYQNSKTRTGQATANLLKTDLSSESNIFPSILENGALFVVA